MEKRPEGDLSKVESEKPKEVTVKIGSVVDAEINGILQRVRIIGDDESVISDDAWNAHYDSPAAQALLRHKMGDIVEYSVISRKTGETITTTMIIKEIK